MQKNQSPMNMKRLLLVLMYVAGMTLFVACGGNTGKGAKTAGDDNTEQTAEAAGTPESKTDAAAAGQERKADAKKWYEGDFTLTEKMYVGSASMTRIYARKGNIVIGTSEGSLTTSLFVCTDSTRTEYLIGNEKGRYAKRGEKSGFSSVDEAVYKYLKGQMSETVFGKTFKKGEEGTTTRDTTIFGRPAYIITKEATEKNSIVEVWGKTIMYIDKENGMPYYKWSIMKTNGSVTREGVIFEVTDFSDKPTYEGLIVSLDGLTAID